MVYVIKANGERARFDRERILQTCIRSGVSSKVAERIVSEVEGEIKNGITTRRILKIVLSKLDQYESKHAPKYKLKQAIAELDPRDHEFERYIEHLLAEQGYKTKWDTIVPGELIEHQIDVIAEKDGKRYLIECKHHVNPHRLCGLSVALTAWATLDDIQRGYAKNITKKKYDNLWLITNTKFSQHAIRYATAKGLLLTGWKHPGMNDLRDMVNSRSSYPLTILNLKPEVQVKFTRANIFLLHELLSLSLAELQKKTGIPQRELQRYTNLAKGIQSKP